MQERQHSKSPVDSFIALRKRLASFSQRLAVFVYFLILISSVYFSTVANAAPVITNTATVNYSINGIPQSLSDSVQFTKDSVVPPSDTLSLNKQASPVSAYLGENITYTLSVTNPNNHILNNVSIQDTLPSGLVYQTGSAKLNNTTINSGQISYSGNLLTINLGIIPANTSWIVKYSVKANALGTRINRAVAHSDTATSPQAQASVNIQIRPPTGPVIKPLVLSKKANKDRVKPGDIIGYSFSIANQNNTIIKNAQLQDFLPIGLEYIDGSAKLNQSPLTANTSSGLVFPLGDIPAKANWELTYDAKVDSSIHYNQLTNTAKIIATNSQANSNTAKATVEISNSKITINKTASKNSVLINNKLKYTITIKNPAQHDFSNLKVNDVLPKGFTYITGSTTLNGQAMANSAIQIDDNKLTFSIGHLGKGQSLTLVYQVNIEENANPGEAINSAQAESVLAKSGVVTAAVSVRTPSTIKFLKIDNSGVLSIIPPTSFEKNQNGEKHWQETKSISLPDGTKLALPTTQPLIEATHYSFLDPVVIEVKDLDQNLNSKVIDTIIVKIVVPGTTDKETLLLKETTENSGIFRGVILTTSGSTSVYNGVLSLQAGSKIRVTYQDKLDHTDATATAALVIPGTQVSLRKEANKESASIGEFVRYTLSFSNTTNFTIPELRMTDILPLGFRYIPDSTKLNGVLVQSGVTTDGRNIDFKLGRMPSGKTWTLEYLTKISTGVQVGKAINRAYVNSGKFKSNKAHATVTIKDDLMRSKNILTGRVYIGCKTGKDANVLKGVRIYNESGQSVITDSEGFWHMAGVNPGAHVLQMDSDSLPSGYQPILCQETTRHAGSAISQFVNLQAGTLWTVNFHVKQINHFKTTSNTKENSQKLIKTGGVSSNKKPEKVDPLKLYGKEYLEATNNDFEILWPKDNYIPEVASTKIFVKSSPQHKIEVFLNSKKVSPLNYEGSETNKAGTVIIRRWFGVDIDIKNRNNTLLVIAKDKNGNEIARKTHNIHFSGEPASAELLTEESILIADGKTTPVIALRIKDEEGYPMRANTHGYFTLEDSRYQIKTQKSDKDKLDLNESIAGSYQYQIEENGIARIELNPTTQSGEIALKIKFTNSSDKTIRAWLKPQLRNWIMVGIAEGTIAHKTLTGNMQALKDLDKADKFYNRGRIAFFAKGQIKGKYLLTIAYDTHKSNQDVGSQLEGNIDPDAWYTIYGDNSNSQHNAPSSRKLYLKIEKDNFYALFGDYRTAMNVTELAKYERVLNGLKSEYQDKRYSINAFISETSNKHHHEEIPGDGTSGLYRLNHDIVANSETIRIETRDRFHSEKIIETRELQRYQDYNIDYNAGTLFFKFPVSERDQNLNPNFIIVDYESEANSNKEIVAGGRIAVKTNNEKLEVGLSTIYVNKDKAKDDSLFAIDASYKITPNTTIHAEIARSNTAKSQYKSVDAQIIELERQIADMEARLFYRKQGENFGIDSQASESGTEKTGAELHYRFNDKTSLKAEVSHQKNIANQNTRQLAEITLDHRYKKVEVKSGLRYSREKLSEETLNNKTILLGAQYTTKNNKITFRGDIEKNINNNNESEISPDRIVVGVDVKLKQGITLFTEHETTKNSKETTHNSRIGLSKDLWKGATGKTSYTQERTDEGQRNYATLGLSQQLNLTDKIRADISIDRAVTIGNNTQPRFNINEPKRQGALRDDYTAFSVGLGANNELWSWTSRFEFREGDSEDKINLRAGLIRHLENGKRLSAEFSYIDSDNINGEFEKNIKLSFGTAWHPKEEDFVFFSRLDLIDENGSGINNTEANDVNSHTQKIVHNMHYNQRINDKTQISVHHGIKYVKDKSNNIQSTTTVDTGTLTVRRDINKKWDIGAHAGYLRDWTEHKTETVAGVSVGVTPAKNAWLEFGYNFEGFNDEDFDNNNYTRKGPYINFSYKFNQDTISGDLPIHHNKNKPKIKKDDVSTHHQVNHDN